MGGSGGRRGKGGYKGGGAKPAAPRDTGGGGGGGGGYDACLIHTNTSLASPNPAVVGTLGIGSVLDVVLNATGANPVVEVRTAAGAVAGTLAGIPILRTLIECLQGGSTYVFEVSGISGGRVDGILRNA